MIRHYYCAFIFILYIYFITRLYWQYCGNKLTLTRSQTSETTKCLTGLSQILSESSNFPLVSFLKFKMSQLIKVFDSKNGLENMISYFIHGLVSSLRGSVLQFHDPHRPNSQRQMAAISALQVCSSPLSLTGTPLSLAGRPHWIKTPHSFIHLFWPFKHKRISFKSRSMSRSAMNAALRCLWCEGLILVACTVK